VPVADPRRRRIHEAPSASPIVSPIYPLGHRPEPTRITASRFAGPGAVSMFEYFSARNSDTDYDSKVLGELDKAIALDPTNIHAYQTKGQFLLTSGRPREALRVIDAGLAVDSNSAPLLAMRSAAHTNLRRVEEAKSDIRPAMLLSPRDPSMPMWNISLRTLSSVSETLRRCDRSLQEGDRRGLPRLSRLSQSGRCGRASRRR
jgi:hypothetical protein